MSTTTASAIFTAAHAAAKVADAVVVYKVRFSTALKSAWAAAKQTINAIMETPSTAVVTFNNGRTATFALTAEAQAQHRATIAAHFAGDTRRDDSFYTAEMNALGNAEYVEQLGAPYYFCELVSVAQIERRLSGGINRLIKQSGAEYVAAERHEDSL